MFLVRTDAKSPDTLFASLIVSQSARIQWRERLLSISAGFTAAEICEVVFEYQGLAHGRKAEWLIEHGITGRQMRRWRDSLFEGDLDRGLIPREGSPVTVPPGKRTAVARTRAAERAAHEIEVERLNARIRELQEANDALGKAIGLLHERSEHEPADAPMTTDRSDSSTPRTDSSPS
jgi:transposase-like protein